MTQATPALPAAARRRVQPAGQASAGARFVKLLAAVVLLPVLALLLLALVDIHFMAALWLHVGLDSAVPWQRLTQSLPGLLGLMALGAGLGAWLQPLTQPEHWLMRYTARLAGGQEAPGQDGSFLVRWLVFELPLWALMTVALATGLRWAGYATAGDITLCAAPLCYGLYLAHLTRQLSWKGEICREDGTLFAWISSAVAQVVWLAAGLVFFLQAKPVWQFTQEWFDAAAIRAVQVVRLLER